MSRRPIALSADLLKLRNEGYDLDVRDGHLLVRDVPYVDALRNVKRGTLVVRLTLAGDVAQKPADHVAYWIGEHPCHSNGAKLTAFENPSQAHEIAPGLRVDFLFSAKADYRDYHHKVTTYVGRIAAEASVIEPAAMAQTYPPVPEDEPEGVFNYVDTASSRSGIAALNAKFGEQTIGIVGLGGTGAYILDFVAKTPVKRIHLFDADLFLQHNAFRSPGAPDLETLQKKPSKVEYLTSIYSRMRRGIVASVNYMTSESVHQLDGLTFVFLCLDRGPVKRAIVERLVARGIPFADVGMGLLRGEDDTLSGIIRTTVSTPETRTQAAGHVSYADGDAVANEYATNIQIAELNALNAAEAVIQWKKRLGIYRDLRRSYYAGYSLASGEIISEGLL